MICKKCIAFAMCKSRFKQALDHQIRVPNRSNTYFYFPNAINEALLVWKCMDECEYLSSQTYTEIIEIFDFEGMIEVNNDL